MSTIQLTDDMMSQVINKAILESLTPETRNQLITAAIAELLNGHPVENRRGYGNDKRTNMQIAFDRAVASAAEDIARKEVSENEQLRALFKKMLADACEKIMNTERYSPTIEHLAEAIARGLTQARDRGY